ncbi:MAG TPA: class I SAM-dependent rRNA methyltransferase [Sandaracinaceae bacterium LLY-WYZ-13_1]|nr:class I SAM-dependent rRNA methyltransferase [Sandaracinaceae bacterium LLY-WYZ-13_1]
MARVTLRKGRVQPVWAGHPWVFAQAIERLDGAPAPGDAVEIRDPGGRFLGRGFWSPKSAIPVRIVTRSEDEPLDSAALVRRIERAFERRRRLGLPSGETDGYRLIHAEGDGLPGLICDVYRDVAVVQLLIHGTRARAEAIVGAVARVTGVRSVVELPGGRAQRREGIEVDAPRVMRGPDVERLVFAERGFEYAIELELAQKTGFYFDQRDNRALVERFANGARVLDLYSYVGAFGLAAARGGAREVLAWDRSAAVVAEGASIAHANGFGERVGFAKGDVEKVLGKLHADRERFDLAIVDPPKLAPTVRHRNRALNAYRKLNQRVFGLLAPGGLVLSCSCSGAVRPDDLLRSLALAAADARREVRLLHMGQQGMDHPVPAAFPEGRYLKAALLEVGA